MGEKIKKLKKMRIHREGTDQLFYSMVLIVAIAVILWRACDSKLPFWIFSVVFGFVYAIVPASLNCHSVLAMRIELL